MKNLFTTTGMKLIIYMMIVVLPLIGCKDKNEAALSNNLRVLKITSNGADLKDGDEVENEDLSIQMVFSHSLNTAAFESALSIDAPGFIIAYDETNSFVTITFPTALDFETTYTISLLSGAYGAGGEALKTDYSLSFVTKEFVPSKVSLSAATLSLLEGESTTITATLNETTIDDVVVTLSTSGSAVLDEDYTLTSTSITIPKDALSASVDLTILNDADVEGEEAITIGIESVTVAVESDVQALSFTINDELPALSLKGIMAIRWATETDGSSGKAVHLVATEDIPDLSIFGLGVANNGGGTDGVEFTFPAMSVNAGEDILVTRDPAALEAYFASACFGNFEHVIQSDAMSQNGDDAIELFKGATVIETYGDADVDGTDQDWEYTGTWAYKLGGDWITGTTNCSLASTTTLDSECIYPICDNALVLKGIMAISWDGSGTNGGKAVHLLVNKDISDLSQYGLGVANNGGGTDGEEYTFPSVSVSEGDNILVAREVNTISGYFGSCFDGYDQVFETDAMNQNGDDAIELFHSGSVIETYGDADVDGTGEVWEYAGRWAYKEASAWIYSDADCAATSTSTQNALCPYPFCDE